MDNIFLSALSVEQRLKLESAGISFSDLSVGGDAGIVMEAPDLPQVLRILGASVAGEKETAYAGIKRVTLRINASVTVPDSPHTISADWQGQLSDSIVLPVAQILLPIIDRDVLLHYQSNNLLPIDDGRFHIHVWSLPKKDREGTGSRTPDALWSIPIEADRRFARTASVNGVPIHDDVSGYVVAELQGQNNLYIHLDVFGVAASQEKLLRQVLLHAASLLLPSDKKHDQARTLFVEECSKSAVRALEAITVQDSKHQEPLKIDHKEVAKQLKKQLSELTHQGLTEERKLLRGEGVTLEAIGDEYDGLLQIPKVKDVRVEKNSVVVFTEVLYCRDNRSGHLHEIGAFKIELPFGGSSPIWKNLTRQVYGYKEGQHAPHIWANGSACLGSFEASFKELLEGQQFAVAAQLAIQFVEKANTEDAAGKLVTRWPLARR